MIYESFLEKMGVIWTVTGLARYLCLQEFQDFSKILCFLIIRHPLN
jgi:hypothetical protein